MKCGHHLSIRIKGYFLNSGEGFIYICTCYIGFPARVTKAPSVGSPIILYELSIFSNLASLANIPIDNKVFKLSNAFTEISFPPF